MSTSKFIMAKKLAGVQKSLMSETLPDDSLDGLISLIFKACMREDLTFWFNVLENTVVLNLRDIGHENYELNIRQYYDMSEEIDLDELKKLVLINTFLITKESTVMEGNEASSENITDDGAHVISGDKPVPKHIRNAISTIESKGIPVTVEAIRNHLPLGQMSTSSRIECNSYLKRMEAQ